jgi:excinuclease UvrABC ATPase subunit
MPLDKIIVKGAREHNLKNIDVSIPRDKLVVIKALWRSIPYMQKVSAAM